MQYKGFDSSLSMKGKTAIVTGGASGIGLAVVRMFLQKGANVVIADMAKNCEQTAAELGGNCAAVTGDLLDAGVRAAAADKAYELFSGVDILINSAGVVFLDSAENLSEDFWDKTLNINLKVTFLMSQCVGRKMIESKKGGVDHKPCLTGRYHCARPACRLLREQGRRNRHDQGFGLRMGEI